MTDAITALRTVTPCPSSQNARTQRGFGSLPVELVVQVFKYLSIPCLRRASGLSRTLYASAWDAGLYIHLRITWNSLSAQKEQLSVVEELVQHALRNNLRLSLSFHYRPRETKRVPMEHLKDEDGQFLCTALDLIASALPLLVHLSLNLRDFDAVVMAALGQPAPHLRELRLLRSPARGTIGITWACDLFSGCAPRLCKLYLNHIPMGPSPVHAFARVSSLHLCFFTSFPEISFARHFPMLEDLELEGITSGPYELSQNFSLADLRLHSLGFNNSLSLSSLRRTVDIDSVPVVRFKGHVIPWIEPANDNSDFSLRLAGGPDLGPDIAVTVVPSHRRWKRIYDVRNHRTLPISEKPGWHGHLTYLRMENSFLQDLLSCNTALSAMRRIQVDLSSISIESWTVWPRGVPDNVFGVQFPPEDAAALSCDVAYPYNVPCVALEKLTLFALDKTIAVNSLEVAFLACALGQLSRPKHEKAALALAGIEFTLPEVTSHALLDQTFSVVSRYPFSGEGLIADYDDGLWEC